MDTSTQHKYQHGQGHFKQVFPLAECAHLLGVMFLNIRSYQPGDQQAVLRLDEVAMSDLRVQGLPERFDDLKDIEAYYIQNGEFVVAEVYKEIVGMGAIRYIDSRTARINRMRVDPHHQRKGVARSILNLLELYAQNAGISKIVLNALTVQKKAQKLYESNGYKKVGEGKPDGFKVFIYEKEFGYET